MITELNVISFFEWQSENGDASGLALMAKTPSIKERISAIEADILYSYLRKLKRFKAKLRKTFRFYSVLATF